MLASLINSVALAGQCQGGVSAIPASPPTYVYVVPAPVYSNDYFYDRPLVRRGFHPVRAVVRGAGFVVTLPVRLIALPFRGCR